MTERERRQRLEADMHARISTGARQHATQIKYLSEDFGELLAISGKSRLVGLMALLTTIKSEVLLATDVPATRQVMLDVLGDLMKAPFRDAGDNREAA